MDGEGLLRTAVEEPGVVRAVPSGEELFSGGRRRVLTSLGGLPRSRAARCFGETALRRSGISFSRRWCGRSAASSVCQ